MSDLEMMIISALRYALPRRSYIMSCTEEYIVKMLKDKVSQNFIHVAIQDIKEYIEWNERNKIIDSMQHNWSSLLVILESKYEK